MRCVLLLLLFVLLPLLTAESTFVPLTALDASEADPWCLPTAGTVVLERPTPSVMSQ